MPHPVYRTLGDGPETVAFLHGIGGAKECWQPQLEAFAGSYRAVAWDMPGYGGTPMLAETGFPGLAAALLELVDRLGPAPVHLVGHSMGGMVALEFVATWPERVRSLVLSGTSPAFGDPGGDWQKKFLAARLAPLDAGRTMADLAPDLVAGIVGAAPDPAGVELAVACMARVATATYRAMLAALAGFDRRPALPGIAVPTLVLAGGKDATASPAVMAKMAERIPGAVFQCLPGAGHIANLERPAAFNRAVLGFLDGCRADAAEKLEV